MYFLPEQVNEYDRKRQQMEGVGQLSIFVEDEKTAIGWLRNRLKDKPQTYQDISPDFMQQLSASWKKWEVRPELRLLLDQNFLRYDGTGDVPSQIHSYLSSQFKELRRLPKDDSQTSQNKARESMVCPGPEEEHRRRDDAQQATAGGILELSTRRRLSTQHYSGQWRSASRIKRLAPKNPEGKKTEGTAYGSRADGLPILLPTKRLSNDPRRRGNASRERNQ